MVVRVLILLNLVLATRYITWRALHTMNWDLWPFALALLSAEFFSYADCFLFGVNMWRLRHRGEPPPATRGLTVDVFITTYNEPWELVRATASAARDITYPHATWVLDDGDRPEMRHACEALGIGYIVRDGRWDGKERHAKAGNLINAMYQTNGEFLLILDADQVPRPQILDRVLGYFTDPEVAFVQTPQWFWNTPPGDPFGTDAPLFYGPIQAGKDGWNSAFFCGSNAVLRREALMRVGVVWYARDLATRLRGALRASVRLLRRTRKSLAGDPRSREAVDQVLHAVAVARRAIHAGRPLQEITWDFQREAERISCEIVRSDLARIRADLTTLPGATPDLSALTADALLAQLSTRDLSPLGAISAVRALLLGVDLDRADQVEPVMPLSTVSVTEDMATAMRLHALGWKSVYHHEILAVGLAPEDLSSAMSQRLRWAQGTLQVLLRENPVFQPGLTLPQRALYFGTMWSYLSGFAALVYLVSPVLYLVLGLMPVRAWSLEFLGYLLPWLVVNQILFAVIGWGLATRRGQQYSLALFPIWLKAVATTVGNVYLGRKLGFVVTPKTRQRANALTLIWPQVTIMALLVIAILSGFIRLSLGWTTDLGAVVVNVLWASYSLAMLSVVIRAARWRPAGS